MDIQIFIVNPIVGAIIGYFTNWLAIKMLFRPYKQKKLFGYPLPFTPGLIPKERRRLAEKMGETVGKYLLTDQILTEAFANSDFEHSIDRFIDDGIYKLRTSSLQLRDVLNVPEGLFPFRADFSRDYLVEQAGSLLLGEGMLSKLPLAAEFIEKLLIDQPAIEENLKQFTAKTIEEGVGRWASIFVNEEKVYQNLKKGLIAYLKNEETKSFLSDELTKALPRWAAFGEEKLLSLKLSDLVSRLDTETVEKWKAFFRKGIRYLVEKGAVHVVEGMDIQKLVENRINDFEMEEAEEIILSVVKRELNAITVLGGVLGFAIGMVPAILKLVGA